MNYKCAGCGNVIDKCGIECSRCGTLINCFNTTKEEKEEEE